MAAKRSPVTAAVLRWAVSEDGRSPEDLADALEVEPDAVRAWINGREAPSSGQVTKLARLLKRPRALFFLPAPPTQASLPPSFRHPPGDASDVSAAARTAVRRARRVQRAVSWARRAEDPIDVPMSRISRSAEDAAQRAREWLDVSIAEQLEWDDDRIALNAWREALEERGVLVFALEVGRDDVRGFSSWDDRAPLIVTNISSVSPSARSFTLAHELGHLVLREDAACIEQTRVMPSVVLERWCEEFGAEVLLPRREVADFARSRRIAREGADIEDVKALASMFHVSHRAAALRYIDLGLGARDLYGRVLAVFRPVPPARRDDRDFRRPARSTSRLREYGPRTLRTVLTELPTRDALSILRMDVEDTRKIAEQVPGVRAV